MCHRNVTERGGGGGPGRRPHGQLPTICTPPRAHVPAAADGLDEQHPALGADGR